MKLSLEVMTEGNQQGKLLPITLSQFVIGRDPQCQLRPASSLISKRHCALIQREGKVYVRDFDSMNGTFVNDQPVKDEVELKHGDALKVGPITFLVRVEAAPKAKAPAAGPQPSVKVPAAAPKAAEPAPEPAGDTSDEDMAAMMLSLDGGDAPGGSSGGEVPDGSTVMEVPVPPDATAPGAAKKDEKPKDKNLGNTSAAARELLDKFMKRPRK